MNKSQTSKAYQALNQEEPLGSPPDLDAAILAQAHKAVQSKPQVVTNNVRSHLTLRWGAPIASAALVVLSVTVFIVMPELEQQQAVQSYKQDSQAYQLAPALEADMAMQDTSAEMEMEEKILFAESLQVKERRKVQSEKANPRVVKRVKKLEALQAPASATFNRSMPEPQTNTGSLSGRAPLLSVASDSQILSPELWSQNILDLIERGEWLNADKQFKEFAKHYPEHEFNKEYVKLKQD